MQDSLGAEHSLAMIEEISPESTISYVENFYLRHPDKYDPSKVDNIKSVKPATREHIKRHIQSTLSKRAKRKQPKKPKRVAKVQLVEGVPAIRLGPYGPKLVPVPVSRKVIFERRGFVYLQARALGRFVKEQGATSHTLRTLRTFLRAREREIRS